MFGQEQGHNLDRDDTYGYEEEKLEWFERFDFEPVDPATVSDRHERGETLRTLDLPQHLSRQLAVDPGTGLVLYRLTQLFGTPNVDVWTAGSDMPERSVTTWLYLFEVTYADPDGDDREFLLSIYDYRTDVSTGLSCWVDGTDGSPPVAAPDDDVPAGLEVPDDEFCKGLVQLTLNVIEEPVPATYSDLWV